MILLLHTLVEGLIGLLLIFYPDVQQILPGFAEGSGRSYKMVLDMYGLAALLLAGISLIAYLRRDDEQIFLFATGLLTAFHFAMSANQAFHNPDQRAMLLHFLLGIFLGALYFRRRKLYRVGDMGKS